MLVIILCELAPSNVSIIVIMRSMFTSIENRFTKRWFHRTEHGCVFAEETTSVIISTADTNHVITKKIVSFSENM